MKGNSLIEWLVKLIFFLMLLPFFVSLAFQMIAAVFQGIMGFLLALLPFLIGLAALIGLVAGVGAGVTMRRRLPRQQGNRLPPGGVPPVRRPRGPGRQDEE
jgi:hypothetical protein